MVTMFLLCRLSLFNDFLCNSVYITSKLSIYLSIYLYIYLSIYLSIYISIYLSIYDSTALVDLGRYFSFLIYTQSVELLGRGISPSQGRYLLTEHKYGINAHRQPCLELESNPWSQCSSERRRFMDQTARPLRSANVETGLSVIRGVENKCLKFI
jgi:hypothetical protein